jgi:hypothetical protein
MLLLLLKNMMWAAWWPYATMLLALEKAVQQREREAPRTEAEPRSGGAPQAAQAAPGRDREDVMGNESSSRPERAEPLREMMKLGIAQAQHAFEIFVATSEKTWRSLENVSPLGRAGLFALNAKIAEIARKTAEAHFALANRLAGAKDLHEALELQNRHMKQQMDAFAEQLEEMRDLVARIVEEAGAAQHPGAGPRPAAQDNAPPGAARFAAYAPSSSVTPGSTGRGS